MAFNKKRKKPGFFKRRKCEICENKLNYVDYKDVELLNKFVSGVGQIKPRSQSGNCAKDQRKVANAIKRARFMALMPYAKERIRVVKQATGNNITNNSSAASSKTEKN